MSDAAIRQRERVCAALGCVPGRAPVSTSGPLPLTLLAPRCERCGEATWPDWTLRVRFGHGLPWALLEADGRTIRGQEMWAGSIHGALTRWDERTVHAGVGDVRLEASV